MSEITREQFIKEITELNERKTTFDVNSMDGGGIALSMNNCIVEINEDDNEIVVRKPYTFMETGIDFQIIESISKEDSTYAIEFNNGLADVEIEIVNKEM